MKKVVKYTFITILFVIIGALIVRTILHSDKSVFDDFKVTDASREVYAEEGELSVLTMGFKHKTSENGYFSAYSLFYVEETGELQVTVRYNVSALKYTDTESEEDIGFFLMKRVGEDLRDKQEEAMNHTMDRTPSKLSEKEKNENYLENYTGEYFYPASVETESRYGIYKYRKLIFENVPLEGEDFSAEDVIIVMGPAGSVAPDEDAEPLERLEVYRTFFDRQYMHYTAQPYEEYSLTKKNIESLEK